MQQLIAENHLQDRIECVIQDYRDVTGSFDKIVSIEMVEALGDAYVDTFFGQCGRLLKTNGLVGIQMITCPDSHYHLLKGNVDFIQKHIFPGGQLLSIGRVQQAINKETRLHLLDLFDFGGSYAETLRRWRATFVEKMPAVQAL